MFTGIVEDLAEVGRIGVTTDGAHLTVRTSLPVAHVAVGDSIAVSGACLTVVGKARRALSMDVSAETLRRTTLGRLRAGDPVNLERCLTMEKLLGGHLVQGHVDGVGRIVSIKSDGDSRLYSFEIPADQARYLIEKGSVTIDGVSLTIFEIRGRRFTCALIPHTLKVTTLGKKRAGDPVNIEADLIGKWVERFLGERRNGKGTAASR